VKKKVFEVKSDRLFLTLPQCELSKAVLQQKVESLCPKSFEIAQEVHGDGGTHFHCLLLFDTRRTFTGPELYGLFGKALNVQKARSIPKVRAYLRKEDPKPVSHGPFGDLRSKATGVAESIGQEILGGEHSFPNLFARYPGYCVQHAGSILQVLKFGVAPPEPVLIAPDYNSELDIVNSNPVYLWLAANMDVGHTRTPRTRQLWIWGKPGLGKSYLISRLAERYKCYYVPYDEDWFDGFTDDHELAIFDEYKSQKKLNQFNQFVGGHKMPLSRRGQAPYLKSWAMPCIVCSNYHPCDCYDTSKANIAASVDAMVTRFTIYEAGTNFKAFVEALFVPDSPASGHASGHASGPATSSETDGTAPEPNGQPDGTASGPASGPASGHDTTDGDSDATEPDA